MSLKRPTILSAFRVCSKLPQHMRGVVFVLFCMVWCSSVTRAAVVFNFSPGAGITPTTQQAYQAAADIWSSLFYDNVTINLAIDFAPLGGSVLAGTTPQTVTSGYSTFRTSLIEDLRSYADMAAVISIPNSASFDVFINRTANHPDGSGNANPYLDNDGDANNSTVWLTRANAKAIGLLAGNAPSLDASIVINSTLSYDFDRSDGIGAGAFDFVGVAVRQIGIALGFISGVQILDTNSSGPFYPDDNFTFVSPLDMFRYSSESAVAGAIDFTADNRPKYFSLTQGYGSTVNGFSTGVTHGDGFQPAFWKDGLGIGIMQPVAATGTQLDPSGMDLLAFDVIGWDLTPASVVPEPDSVILGLFGAGLLVHLRRMRQGVPMKSPGRRGKRRIKKIQRGGRITTQY